MDEMKSISDTFLYRTIGKEYGKRLFDFIMTGERVDKRSEGFGDILFDIKRQVNSILIKVLLSNKVVLISDPKGLSRAFKVLYAKDVKDPNHPKKVFIDCTNLITLDNGVYKCKSLKTLIAYLTTAMVYIIYYEKPKAIVSNATLTKLGTGIFVDLMLYVMGYLKVPVTYADNKERMMFIIAEYYQLCVLGAPPSDNIYNVAKKVSGIEDKKTCDYLHALFSFTLNDPKCDFNKFLIKFAEVFLEQKEDDSVNVPKNRARLTADGFVQRWMYAFGPGTFLGLECFVPFSQIVTDCVNGGYINLQATIEKVAGSKNTTQFYNELIKIGSEN